VRQLAKVKNSEIATSLKDHRSLSQCKTSLKLNEYSTIQKLNLTPLKKGF
jgi:hypothetical protein